MSFSPIDEILDDLRAGRMVIILSLIHILTLPTKRIV